MSAVPILRYCEKDSLRPSEVHHDWLKDEKKWHNNYSEDILQWRYVINDEFDAKKQTWMKVYCEICGKNYEMDMGKSKGGKVSAIIGERKVLYFELGACTIQECRWSLD